MGRRRSNILLAAANLLIPVAVLVFAIGFFPYKPFLPGLARYEDLREYGYEHSPAPPFDKIIFMVVDALRSDFVYSAASGFKFTQSLIRNGAALPFTAHAASPTVTMPKVKAITTGSIPSFLDLILNFAESDTTSTLAHQDTWLAQVKAKGDGKLVMYGDDTWLKLFPDTFDRADGTSSFFVSWQDFTEVDNNVTRHIPGELGRSDWNAMIMHYLGLDHIGHKAGPQSPNMVLKQVEMDGIVKQIYEAIEREQHLESTLFVLCGDHGMNDAGNHGGSGPGETSPALVFMSPKLKSFPHELECPISPKGDFNYYKEVEQSDIAPTLAGLLGVPVPLNNLGVFMPDLLAFWPKRNERIQLLLQNAMQMLRLVKLAFPHPAYEHSSAELDCSHPSSSGEELACQWQKIRAALAKPQPDPSYGSSIPLEGDSLLAALIDFCMSAQEILSSQASNYNMLYLLAGLALSTLSVLLTLAALYPSWTTPTADDVCFGLLILLYGIMMFGSSYVEEEQHFWYWTCSAWLLYLFVRKQRTALPTGWSWRTTAYLVTVIVSSRLLQRWNQTGQKHAGSPDIVSDFLLPRPGTLWTLVVATYLVLQFRLSRHFSIDGTRPGGADLLGISTATALCGTALLFKMCFTARDAPELITGALTANRAFFEEAPLVTLARVVFCGIGIGAAYLFVRKIYVSKRGDRHTDLAHGLHDLLTLLLITQSRVQNIPLFLLFKLQHSALASLPTPLTPSQTTLTTLLFTHVSFFSSKNSNSISSIDLGNAYNGVADYNVLAVGLLVFVSNWAGPIWWAGAGVLLLLGDGGRRGGGGSTAPETMGRTGGGIEGAGGMGDGTSARKWVLEEREALRTAATQSPSAEAESSTTAPLTAPPPPPPPPPSTDAAQAQGGLFFGHLARLTLFTGAGLLAVMAACTALRTHLFIWTVFSPKYLYAMAWSLAFHFGGTLGWGAVLWAVGRR